MNNEITVKDKVIFLTGALGLIGTEISTHFLKQGAFVALTDVDLSKADARKKELATLGIAEDQYLLLKLDITNEENCEQTVAETINKFGRIDVLINNAAIDAKFDKEGTSKVNMSRFEHYPLNALRQSVEVNLIGTVIISQVVCRQMLKQRSGNIINVASTYSVVAPNQSLYDYGNGTKNYKPIDYIASKSFIPNFTRYLATFYARDGIRCNAIVPHGIYNNHPESFLQNWEKLSPIGRMCDRSELDGPFTFLASDASSYMTGSVMMYDGGWTAW
ncbi:MAG: SDR family oxidoreductase [Dysgonamonadaceae bacterium]|jgi:NAD(P)-dependent dehydrogenase (short-subunit alcohol dehydrogenase family)|nr:SDR family oxidoreductase [Dysgonamonadaceae bacterium]MDD3308837.1 SDR family oxidoreductase [Dysgonamonadaceae bacterium]MDD3900579.1 SDR family oxidoreductase [Dysgonamonadaceae bacterium]MDD4398980.1 SDR family oxidoreductase [Dysgonamonadaceae bacterium]MEA5080485.1 SDR family oxidoreductase [Dysgonamonadaceae bacterium]